MALEFIKPEDAPRPLSVSSRSKRMEEYDGYMQAIIDNHPRVARFTPEGKESTRALRLRVSQAITRCARTNTPARGAIHAWTGSDGTVLVQYDPDANKLVPKERKAREPKADKASGNGSAPTAPTPEAKRPQPVAS